MGHRGRTAQLPVPPTPLGAASVLQQSGAAVAPLHPCGCEVTGLNLAGTDGIVSPEVAGALEVLMAHHGFVLLRGQGNTQYELANRSNCDSRCGPSVDAVVYWAGTSRA